MSGDDPPDGRATDRPVAAGTPCDTPAHGHGHVGSADGGTGAVRTSMTDGCPPDRNPHRVLVTYASSGGSTAEIAQALAGPLLEAGYDIDVDPVRHVKSIDRFTALVIGSALYHGFWLPDAFKFLVHHRRALATRPVWLFDSGPLDRSAEENILALPRGVADIARSIGVRGHATFGGRLGRTGLTTAERLLVLEGRGGDYRNFEDVRAWAVMIVRELARIEVPLLPGAAEPPVTAPLDGEPIAHRASSGTLRAGEPIADRESHADTPATTADADGEASSA